MPRNAVGCVICGGAIDKGEPRWISEFRALYTDDHDWTNVRLSGVGTRGPTHDYAPRDSSSSYYDPKLDPSTLIDIWLLKVNFRTPPPAPPPAPTQTAWGFPFHASCWDLMVKLLDQEDMDKRCLFDILLSLPQQQGYLDWGHDYGRLLCTQVDVSLLLPGEERVLGGLDYDNMPRTSTGLPVYTFDPLAIPDLLALRSSCLKSVDHEATARNSTTKIHTKPDSFRKLPVEIIQIILNTLQSRDVLHLKIASSVVAATPLPKSFWASRFLPGHEFEYSWKRFYLGVKNLLDDANLRNRWRISKLIFPLRNLLSKYSLSTCSGTPLQSFFEPNEAPSNEGSWTSASRAVVDPEDFFTSGCRALRLRLIRLPDMLTAVFISFIDFGDNQYISGIRFQQHDKVDTCLGYIQRSHESILDSVCPMGNEGHLHISGFILAMDLRGIRGISLLTIGGVSKWLGEHEGIPKKRLTIGAGRVQLLKAGFDAMKIVSLAVSEGKSTSSVKPSSLRDEAFWLPVIPPEGLLFNDHSRNKAWVVRTQRPYNMILFGGSRGENLSKLVKVVVWIVGFYHIYGIDFKYNTEVDGRKIHTLGRCGPFSDAEPRLEAPHDNSADQRISFDIDGPGGERIIHVYLQNEESGDLNGFRVRNLYLDRKVPRPVRRLTGLALH
ncbi:uncharacterized protein BDZ99DRAFT_391143 [Mytilinidion resinicola]|uniref:F-box domain-containing protein n=1 Tax=Mytilinidion resinicola TaxID=574789 RepID=A0A6A6YHM1_9PEZI|nr:uncharacterized protein BDZ99DRAFT_391143 [Mytilinidion resinicola]KAF2808301.1 hypothetical protein BDZ99DRAFT_391143 [Mytilinidion resinicola]